MARRQIRHRPSQTRQRPREHGDGRWHISKRQCLRAASAIVSLHLTCIGLAGCDHVQVDLEGWPCNTRDDCVAGYACSTSRGLCVPVDQICVDNDGDGLGDGTNGNPGCIHPAVDSLDSDPSQCGDTDKDSCDDCDASTFDPLADGTDTDSDGLCDAGDPDDDEDGVLDEQDIDPLRANLCTDADADGCDDCSVSGGPPDISNDGVDTDKDGACDFTDVDDDGDAVADDSDPAPIDARICGDVDADSCDDCALSHGPPDPANDGEDTDYDGECNLTDQDDDNDTVADGDDLDPLDPSSCRDDDNDTCDDCSRSKGPPTTSNDGQDSDSDGLCDAGDADQDDDSVANADDVAPLDPSACRDVDGDTCDDCGVTIGSPDPSNDGPDGDVDGICDAGDRCTDFDHDGVGNNSPNNTSCAHSDVDSDDTDPGECTDTDLDDCDDCTSGYFNPANDGIDTDANGICDKVDPDDDGDGVLDKDDSHPIDKTRCADTDADGCDDCSSGSFAPSADGADGDDDGQCDDSDDCTDADRDGVGNGNLGNAGCIVAADDLDDHDANRCLDAEGDGCDDCAVTGGPPATANDGVDTDGDQICDVSDDCTDVDDDTLGNGNLGNTGCASTATDIADNDARRCQDSDGDSCDDCAVTRGPPAPNNDGADGDGDTICDATDACTDDDGDGLGNGNLDNTDCSNTTTDENDANRFLCADIEPDTCNDCVTGTFDPSADGADQDDDGLCDKGDGDRDGDGVNNGPDLDAIDPYVCADSDSDGCDDCSVTAGPPATSNDGSDRDSDGICDAFDWFDVAWEHRKPLSINTALIVGTLADFPVLLSTVDSDLKTKARADGKDLLFADSDGITPLDHEIEQWDPSTGTLVAWVRLTALSSGIGPGPHLHLYYGNPSATQPSSATGVWDGNYRAVWHLNEDPLAPGIDPIRDSTINGNNGSVQGDAGAWSAADSVAGPVANAFRFDHGSAYVNMGSRATLSTLDPLTLELWFQATSWGAGYGRMISKTPNSGFVPLSLYPHPTDTLRINRGRDTEDQFARAGNHSVQLNTWHHVAVVIDTATDVARIYVNGSEWGYEEFTAGAGAVTSDASFSLLLGNRGAQDRPFAGVLDEVRVSAEARTLDWIRTSFNNQSNPGAFVTKRAEQQGPQP